jgi:hypothetical protein
MSVLGGLLTKFAVTKGLQHHRRLECQHLFLNLYDFLTVLIRMAAFGLISFFPFGYLCD